MQKNNIKILRKISSNNIKTNQATFFTKKKVHFSLDENKIFITCQAGLESLVKKDNEKIGLKNFIIHDRIVRAIGTEKQLYEALIWNRFSNRIYLELHSGKATTFNELFDLVGQIEWRKILPSWIAIVTEATSIKSQLAHTPSIQSITKKSIVTNLTEWTGTHRLYEDRTGTEAHIQFFLINDVAYILLDITGNALHKRWWRTESWDAPIKETLAASIIALSWWKFWEKFLDPFCWSGTIAIEAALLARNIAPGIGRHFAIENFPFFQKKLLDQARTEARSKIYPSGNYKIIGSDINIEMIEKSKRNAMRAGVENDITFIVDDFFEKTFNEKNTIITNPPYWLRLKNYSDEDFYKKFISIFEKEFISWWFITSYEEAKSILTPSLWKDRKLYNWWLPARFYKKWTVIK